jgi:acetyl esterase/lipase
MTQTNLTRPQGLNRIDPVLREAAIGLGVAEFRAESLSVEREHANRLAAERVAAAEVEAAESAVAIETRSIDGPDGRPLNLRFYRGVSEGSEGSSGAPLVLYAHGGGFVSGNLDTDHAQCVELARAAGCLVVSVDYRLAPEDPCPAALDDVEAGLRYVAQNGAALDADPSRIAVMGRDAGAALVAGLSQRMFDDEGPQILMQILHQPMLDCDATSSRREFQRTPGLNGQAVSRAWGHYLGPAGANGQYVPAHRANLEGLPPTFISCSEIDPCRDEAIDYANRLLHAYVHTELHVIAATFNGFDILVPDWVVSQENRALHARSLCRVFAM